MKRQGDNRPATAKLGKFGHALIELRERMQQISQQKGQASASSEGVAPSAGAASSTKNANAPLRHQASRDMEKAILASNPALKPSWAKKPAAEKDAGQKLPRRLLGPMLRRAKHPSPAVPKVAENAAEEGSSNNVESQPLPPPDPFLARAKIAAQIKATLASATPRVEERAEKVSEATRAAIEAALMKGADLWSHRPERDFEGFILGLDLGTSAVKCAYRQPYRADDPVRCLTVPPELSSFAHPCLWQTVIWFDPSTHLFTLFPTDGAVAIDGFKSGLINDRGLGKAHFELDVCKAEAMTAFLALQLAYALGAYAIHRPLGSVGAEHYLTINIGIPVAAHDDRATLDVYKKIANAARDLAAVATELKLEDVRTVLRDAAPELPEGMQLVPELVAAMSAYVADPTSPDGAHFLVDVGASTLDMVAFNLLRRQQISVFTASVEALGAAALNEARLADIEDADFKRACDDAFENVYGGARRKAPSLFHPGYRKTPVQLLTTGGGCQTTVHEPFIDEMIKPKVLGDWTIVEPRPPAHITAEQCDKARLLVAYGLTRDDPEFLACRLPSQIDDLPPRPAPTTPFISKDDV